MDIPWLCEIVGDRDVTLNAFEVALVEAFIRRAELRYEFDVVEILPHPDGKWTSALGNSMFIDSLALTKRLQKDLPNLVTAI